jgi:TRAP-type mannitol/chloroaromatic compound transport system substrate-binding protein
MIVKSWPAEVLHDLRAATIEVLNERAAADSDFNAVLNSLREFTVAQQLYWKYNNVIPTKRFNTNDDATWPGWD